MSPRRRLSGVLLITLLVWTAGCADRETVHEYNFLALGTLVKVSVYSGDETSTAAAVRQLEDEFAYLDANLYPSRGLLGDVNDGLREDGEAQMDPMVAELVERGMELEGTSGGLFNPALGELVDLWGFLQDERPPGVPPPDPRAIQAILGTGPAMARLRTSGARLETGTPVYLDFGAFAKGYALQRGVAILGAAGITDALINAGGDISVMGRHGDRAWRIGIRSPGEPGVLGGIEMHNGETVVTSGDYERFFEYEGRRYHHILDPRDGYPAALSRSVTVIHDDPVLADAAATALFVAGPPDFATVAASMGVRYVMLVDHEHGLFLTPDMVERFVPARQDYETHIVELP